MASKKLPKKPTMAQAFNAAQGPAVNRPNSSGPIDYPGPGTSPQARKAQSARMTGQANRGSATENLAKRIKTDAARKKAVPGFKADTVRKTVDTGLMPTPGNVKKSLEVLKAQALPSQSTKEKGKGVLNTKYEITKPYKGAGSQASKKKK
jgi:hypothetical protein